jgi:hypothetical protein
MFGFLKGNVTQGNRRLDVVVRMKGNENLNWKGSGKEKGKGKANVWLLVARMVVTRDEDDTIGPRLG